MAPRSESDRARDSRVSASASRWCFAERRQIVADAPRSQLEWSSSHEASDQSCGPAPRKPTSASRARPHLSGDRRISAGRSEKAHHYRRLVGRRSVGPDRRCVVLKAASPVGGRAITLYERVFPFKRYNSPSAHGEFLRDLHRILPEGTRPIVVTDAGFHVPWFRDIETYGWDWVGRIRGRIKFYCERMERWRFAHSLHTEATSVPRFVGQADLARRKRHPAQLYIVRAYKVRRGRPRREQVKSGKVQGYRRLYKTPWLLATSLPHEADSARRVKKLYALRMQIEETFRDLKCHRWGFGLRYARSNNAKRLEILVLIGTLASLVAWLVGLAGRTAQWNWSLQANTERKRQVLSTFFIGRQLVARSDFEFSPSLFRLAMAALQRALALSFCT
jgi:hypothetical protein